MPRSFLLCVLCASVVSSSSLLAQDDPVLRQLRQHGDYPAIERYCRQELKTTTTLDRRAELIAELAGSLAQQANTATDAARAESQWKETDQMLADFIKTNPKHARAILMQRQQVIYAFAHGEQLRQQAALSEKTQDLDAARAQLQRAEELAVALEKSSRQELDAYNAKAPRLPFAQLTSLSNDVPYRLAQIRLSLAHTHEPKSQLRAGLLGAAAKGFEFYTREGYSDDELIVRAHLGLAACRRLQRDFEGIRQALAPIEQSKTAPASFKDEALALHMQALLDLNQPAAARALLEGRSKLSAGLALANVRALLVEAQQQAKRDERQAAIPLQGAAFDAVAVGEREHGAAWAAQAEGLLAALGDPGLLGGDQRAAVRLASVLHRHQRLGPAAQAYARAAELAREAKQVDQAFDLSLRAGRLLAESGSVQAAIERLRALQERAPSPEKAAEASSACIAALLRLQEKPTENDRRELREQLDKHIARFPGDQTTPQVRHLAGALAMGEGDYQRAISHFAAIPIDHPLFPSALEEIADCYQNLRQKATNEDARRVTDEALARLDRVAQAPTFGKNEQEVRAILDLSRAQLLVWPAALPKELQEACRLLRALEGRPSFSDVQRSIIRTTLVLAYAGLENFAEAARLAERLDAQESRLVRRRLSGMTTHLPADRQRNLAALQLQILNAVAKDLQLAGVELLDLLRDEAWALARLGQAEGARKKLAALRQQFPRDADLAEDHARLLMLLATEPDFTEAVGLWQSLAVTHKEGTREWFEAKYQLAACYGKLGQKERSLKVLRLTADLWFTDAETERDEMRKRYRARFKELEAQLMK